MNAIEIVELVIRILAMGVVSASVIGIVWYGLEAAVDGFDMWRSKKK